MPSEGNLGESLALAVLENYQAANAWNRHNWLLGAETVLGRGAKQALA
jgi:hypothetical protein